MNFNGVTSRLSLNQFEKDKNFVFRRKIFPINFKIFKVYSNYFHKTDYEDKKDLIFEYPSLLSENSFENFIKACQSEDYEITQENAYDLLFLSEKFKVDLLIQEVNEYISHNQSQMPIQLLKYKLYSYDENDTDQNNNTYFSNEEKIIGLSLTQYLENEKDQSELLSFPISVLYNILYNYTHQNPNSSYNYIGCNQEIVINFLLNILKKHGSNASILFSFVDFEKQNLDIYRQIKNICLVENIDFQYIYMNETFSKTIVDLINENEKLKKESDEKIDKLKKQIQEIKKYIELSSSVSDKELVDNDNDNFDYEEDIYESDEHFRMQYYQDLVDQLIISIEDVSDKLPKNIILEICRLAINQNLEDDKLEFIIDYLCKNTIQPSQSKTKEEEMIDMQNRDEKIFFLATYAKMKKDPIFKSLEKRLISILKLFKEKPKYAKIPPEIKVVNQSLFDEFQEIETISLHENVTALLLVKKKLSKLNKIIIFPSQNSGTCNILQSISMMENVNAFIQFPNGTRVKVNYDGNNQSINLPPEIRNIPDFFFHECINLAKIKLSDNLIEIGQFAFYKCFRLSEIVFPENLEKIGDSAFNGCKSLEKVSFNKNLEFIGSNAFSGCVKLSIADLSQCIRVRVNVKDFPEKCKVILPHKKLK